MFVYISGPCRRGLRVSVGPCELVEYRGYITPTKPVLGLAELRIEQCTRAGPGERERERDHQRFHSMQLTYSSLPMLSESFFLCWSFHVPDTCFLHLHCSSDGMCAVWTERTREGKRGGGGLREMRGRGLVLVKHGKVIQRESRPRRVKRNKKWELCRILECGVLQQGGKCHEHSVP